MRAAGSKGHGVTAQRQVVVLAVAVRHDAWHVYCLVAERSGLGQGRALRALVAPALCAAADATELL